VAVPISTPGDRWKRGPEAHDYPAAAAYLSLLFPADAVEAVVAALREGDEVEAAAKDLLRAARLPLLPRTDVHVAKALRKFKNGKKLSPVLLVRGAGSDGVSLVIADGYHRICASYHLGDNTTVPGRIADLPAGARPTPTTQPESKTKTSVAGAAVTVLGAVLLLCVLGAWHVLRGWRPKSAAKTHKWPFG
jgi:hypothetical protein